MRKNKEIEIFLRWQSSFEQVASRAFFKMANLWRPWDAEEEEEESVRSESNQDKGKIFSWYCLQILRQIDD